MGPRTPPPPPLPPKAGPCLAFPDCTGSLLEQLQLQDGTAAHELRWHPSMCKQTYGQNELLQTGKALGQVMPWLTTTQTYDQSGTGWAMDRRTLETGSNMKAEGCGPQTHSCGSMLPSSSTRRKQLSSWPLCRCQIPAVMLVSCMHLAAKLRELHKLHLVATLSKTMPRQMSSMQGKQTYLVQQSCH